MGRPFSTSNPESGSMYNTIRITTNTQINRNTISLEENKQSQRKIIKKLVCTNESKFFY